MKKSELLQNLYKNDYDEKTNMLKQEAFFNFHEIVSRLKKQNIISDWEISVLEQAMEVKLNLFLDFIDSNDAIKITIAN